MGESSSFIGFVFEIPALSVDVILKDERSATEMFVFCFVKNDTFFFFRPPRAPWGPLDSALMNE